jgi:hypothetical protein
VPVLFAAILLAFVGVAAFPCWSYSARWGYVPSAIAGVLLLCAAVIAVGGRSGQKAAEADVEVASAPPVASAYNALHRRLEAAGVEPENAFR